MTREYLKRVLDGILVMPDLQPVGEVTHCNSAVRRAAQMYDYMFAPNLMMNDIIKAICSDVASWSICSGEGAHQYANEGSLVIAARTYPIHGHGAAVYPADKMGYSQSWLKYIPMVANIGKTVGVMKASLAFPVSQGEPSYYRLKEKVL